MMTTTKTFLNINYKLKGPAYKNFSLVRLASNVFRSAYADSNTINIESVK